MAKRKTKTPGSGPNPELARAMVELRRSNAAGTHADRRTRRLRDRAGAKRAAVKDQG